MRAPERRETGEDRLVKQLETHVATRGVGLKRKPRRATSLLSDVADGQQQFAQKNAGSPNTYQETDHDDHDARRRFCHLFVSLGLVVSVIFVGSAFVEFFEFDSK